MTASDGPAASTTPTALAVGAANDTFEGDDTFDSVSAERIELAEEDSAAGLKFWSNATMSALDANEIKVAAPEIGRVTRKRHRLSENTAQENS
jgi:hypothetical protein